MGLLNIDKPQVKTIEWEGYKWETCMEAGRPLHPNTPWYYIDGECVDVVDGELQLRLEYKPRIINWWSLGWKEIVTYSPQIAAGMIRSVEPFPSYGRFECVAKLPKGVNLWPSFWSTSAISWPPEIDFFEGYADENGSYHSDLFSLHRVFPFLCINGYRIEPNIHYRDAEHDNEHRQIKPTLTNKCTLNGEPDETYNEYSCEWTRDCVKWFVNGKLIRTCKEKKVLDDLAEHGMHVIINVWPSKSFNIAPYGDITKFTEPFKIKSFKFTKF